MDVGEWLRSLGLERYEAAFREHEIDEAVLPSLTYETLKELGVIAIGHRLKLIDAIAALHAAGTKATSPPMAKIDGSGPVPVTSGSPPAPVARREAEGERRYLTVMFCDLVGSTSISAQLDAEEWRDLVGAYLEAASAAVTEMGGHVAKKLGDGILALFGYPLAHENDAERAARAALAIQGALTELNRKNAGSGKPELRARIGLDAGPAVVDAAGEIYGDVANVAARVQVLAEPGAVLITAQVQRQVAGLFVAEDRGTHSLKGVPEPTALFKLVRASGGGRRAGQRQLTPLVGRDDEMTMVLRRWERARAGDGQLVMIVGEPGLGKSRLIEEFHARLSDTPHTWVEWSCSQLLQNTPLHPVAEWGRVRFGGAEVTAERRLADLENSLIQVKLDPEQTVPLLAPLLDMPLAKERMPALSGEELRRRQLAALTNWVMAGAKVQPVVLAFEDLHWADPTTIDVLRGIAERGALVPLFVLATTRPEFRPPWAMRSHHGTISLAPLDRAQVHEMMAELSPRHALPKAVVEDVVARSGGVPLFVEEVTRLLLERDGQAGADVIPPTLQQSLMARLDRLGSAREVAQIGSVIGGGFSYKLLHEVTGMGDAPLQAALEKLADADIVLAQGLPPESEYRFKHALIRDAAYENLLKSRRQVLHRRVAEALHDAAAEPELLANHFAQAGMIEAAIEWYGKAGQQSLQHSALVEAISQFNRALDLIATLPATAALRCEQIKLQVAAITPLWSVKGPAAPETEAAVERAQLLIEQAEAVGEPPEDPLLLFVALYGLWTANYIRFNGDVVCTVATRFLALARNQRTTMAPLLIAHRIMGISLACTGDVAGARAHFDQAVTLYNPIEHRPLATRFGADALVSVLSFRSVVMWTLGWPQVALMDAENAVKAARDIGQAASLMYALLHTSPVQMHCGNFAAARAQLNEVIALAEERGASFWKAHGMLHQACALSLAGEASSAVQTGIAGIAAYQSTASKAWMPWYLSHLARAYADLGRLEEAWRCIGEATAAIEATKEKWWEAELHYTAGEIALKSPQPDEAKAQSYFERALSIARGQQAKSFELRASMGAARLWRDQGKMQQARELLAPAYGWFTEGADTRDLKDAKALLAELMS
jgi:class 3 adenylate cyclase/predicted ATPase